MCCCITVIHSSTQKASKEYYDDGWEEILNWVNQGMETLRSNMKVPFSEKRQLVLLRKNKPYRIQKGQEYLNQFNKMDGDVYTFRTKKFFWELMCKYDLFPEC